MVAPAGALARVDRYQLLELIGQGGFGAVYRARHVHTGQVVALKLARGSVDAEAAARILAEGRAAGRLDHPNVVGVLDGGVAETGETFVVMQMLEGETIEQLFERTGPLEVAYAVGLAIQMLDGLAAAHARGVIHRDVKPSNIFVTSSGAGATRRDVIKVIDFGICKLRAAGTTTQGNSFGTGGQHAAFTLPGVALGTPGYMAPEQLGDARSVDARADVYSVGATVYELLSGKKPIPIDGLESWMRRLSNEAAPPLATVAPRVPAYVAAVIDRALARDRDARWPSAAAMRDALAQVASGGVVTLPVSPVATAPFSGAPTLPAGDAYGRGPSYAPPQVVAPGTVRMAAPGRSSRSLRAPAPVRTSSAAWTFAILGIVLAVLSILAVGLFVLIKTRG